MLQLRILSFLQFTSKITPPRVGCQTVCATMRSSTTWWAQKILSLSPTETQRLKRFTQNAFMESLNHRIQRAAIASRNLYIKELTEQWETVERSISQSDLITYALCSLAWASGLRTGSLKKARRPHRRNTPETGDMCAPSMISIIISA
jgi:hypothetical protein